MKLIKGNVDNLTEIYTLMTQKFPPNEMKSQEHFKNLLENFSYHIYILYDKNPVGYSLIYEMENEKILLLDYFFIKKEYQGIGMGTKFLELIENHYNKFFNGLLLEVEFPTGNPKNTEDRRIKFYEKFGAKKTNVEYVFPNSSGGLPMEIMYKPFNFEVLSKNEIEKAIKEILKIHMTTKAK